MKMVPVTSSNISEIGHDPDTNTLGVRFQARKGTPEGTPGPLYHYANVPAEKHAALMAATDSHTRHLNAFIKGAHASTKIEG
jgi:KTSC domain-containing protein